MLCKTNLLPTSPLQWFLGQVRGLGAHGRKKRGEQKRLKHGEDARMELLVLPSQSPLTQLGGAESASRLRFQGELWQPNQHQAANEAP